MAQRTETRFGEVALLGTTYTAIGTCPAGARWNVLLNITNRTSGAVKLRAYIADTTWTTGEPTGGTLKAAICYDSAVPAYGSPPQISGIVMNAAERIVVRADTASSLDIIACGVELI